MSVSRSNKKRETSARTWASVAFSGIALALTYIANATASDLGLERKLQEQELSYIRLYAWPKRMTASQEEVLFTKPSRPSKSADPDSKPISAETGSGSQPKASPPPAENSSTPPPPERDTN